MTLFPIRIRPWLSHPLLGALSFGLLIWLLLPPMIVAMDDDFGYLRSVVETLQRGRPWTYDWLTPWAASMSVLVAGFYYVTQSFTFAIRFSLALSASLGFLGLAFYLLDHGLSRTKSYLIAALLLLSPTVLFMEVMFTSVALYLGCFWMCLWLYHRQRWSWFFVVWFIAFSSRQSAIVWLTLPAWFVFIELSRTKTWWPRALTSLRPAAVVAGGIASFLLLKLTMNPTYGQAFVTKATQGFHPHASSTLLGLLALLAGVGWAGFAALFYDYNAREMAAVRLKSVWCWLALLVICGAGMWGGREFIDGIEFTHSAYEDMWASSWFGLLAVCASMGLVLRPVLPRWDMILAGLGATTLLSLYGGRFDYYYIDGFFWGFAAATFPVGQSHPISQTLPARLVHGVVILFIALLAMWDLRCYGLQKSDLDRIAAVNTIYEQALRQGKIKPHEIGLATFGYIGWRFESHYHQHLEQHLDDLADFMKAVDGWNGDHGMAVITEFPKQLRHYGTWFRAHNKSELKSSHSAITLAEFQAPVLWFFQAKYSLKRISTSPSQEGNSNFNYPRYIEHPFPLNDMEWRRLISGESIK